MLAVGFKKFLGVPIGLLKWVSERLTILLLSLRLGRVIFKLVSGTFCSVRGVEFRSQIPFDGLECALWGRLNGAGAQPGQIWPRRRGIWQRSGRSCTSCVLRIGH